MYWSIFIILRELLNINKAYRNIAVLLTFVQKMSADNIKFVCSNVELVHKVWRI